MAARGRALGGRLAPGLARPADRSRHRSELADLAGQSPAGARGVVATPWLGGARAPWWRPEAAAAFVGLHRPTAPPTWPGPCSKSVAWEVQRCLEAMAERPAGPGPPSTGLALAGSGAAVAGVDRGAEPGSPGCRPTGRRSGQAARQVPPLLAARAVGIPFDLERRSVDEGGGPRPGDAGRYAGLGAGADRVAAAVIGLTAAGPGVRFPRS